MAAMVATWHFCNASKCLKMFRAPNCTTIASFTLFEKVNEFFCISDGLLAQMEEDGS